MRSNSTRSNGVWTRRWFSLMVAFLFCGVLALDATAQERRITGTVISEDGEPLPGVNVIQEGTSNGAITDIDGNYALSVGDGAVIVYSFVGFKSQRITVGSQSVINVTLEVDVAALEEVVVVGYGTQKKSDLTGAVSSLSGENMRGTMTASVDQALQGRMAGVQVTQNTGQPGGTVSIRIRGTSSLTGSSEPLYVIDGVPVSGAGGGIIRFDGFGGAGGQQNGVTNPLAAINPNDIENIEVLKDASATAIYGSRAANGVVIITTKRGKKGDATISYNGFYGIQDVYKLFDMMDLPQYAEYNNEVAQEVSSINADPRFADPSLLGPGTDWQAAIFQPAPMQSHSVSLTGGNDNTNYVLSGGYFGQEGIVLGANYERLNLRLNMNSKVKSWLDVGTNVNISREDQVITLNDGGDGVISQAAQMAPHIPVKDFNGNYAGPEQQNVSAQIGANPVALALLRNNTRNNHRILSNIYANAKIIEGLTFRTDFSFDYGNGLNHQFLPTYRWGTLINNTSQLGQMSSSNFFWSWSNYMTYNKTFGKNAVTLMAGYESQRGRYEGFTAFKVNVPNDLQVMNQGEVSNIQNTGYKGWNSLASQFARINYGYDDRYLLTATIRRDGSSRFGPENRYGWFPSFSAAWRVSNEAFLTQSDFMSDLKLRVGWGQVGNQEIANYTFGSALTTLTSEWGPAVRNARYSNPLVQWESTTMTNIGVDFAFFKNRVQLTAEVYNKLTDNLLLAVNLPNIFGDQVAGPQGNVGSMTNKGIELSLNSVNIDKGKFKWNTTANVTINRNKVTDMQGNAIFGNLYWYSGFQTALLTDAGLPVGQFYGYVMEGIFTSKEEILAHAVQIPSDGDASVNKIERTTGVWLGDIKWKDLNGDGIINTDDQTVIGDPNPYWTFGFNNSISYGPVTLDVFAIGSIGGHILNYSRARNEQMLGNFDNQSVTVQNRARTQLIEGGTDFNNIDHVELVDPTTTMPRFDNGGENFNHYMSNRWIEDATYVRIQNVKLAYTLPGAMLSKAKISRVQIYANVQNFATFTNYTGLDPQIGAFEQSALRQNVDMGRYPAPRVYTMGINVDF